MALIFKCTRCGTMYDRSGPHAVYGIVRIKHGPVSDTIHLCDKCTDELECFIKGTKFIKPIAQKANNKRRKENDRN